MARPVIYYIYDPMCSWCWGYRNTWLTLVRHLEAIVDIRYLVGGLAPDSDEIMPDDMQAFLQQTWQKIAEQLGVSFNFDFWTLCTPRRSTYPACRATLVARDYDKEKAMLHAIQSAYYCDAKNPSDNEVLISLAKDIGINDEEFREKLTSKDVNTKLFDEIAFVRKLPINGFPSLVLKVNGRYIGIPLDYLDYTKTLAAIKQAL
jgi:putative protein-disulfide isomerase